MSSVQLPYWIMAWAPKLHHGFTTQGQPLRLGHGLGHLLGNRGLAAVVSFLPVLLLCVGGSDEWVDVVAGRQRQFIEENLGQRASRTGLGRGQAGWPGQTGSGPFQPGSAPFCSPTLLDQLLTCSLLHVGP
jgi:hypothetical protein